jgi:DNA-binding NarL/FixJ family response regulator
MKADNIKIVIADDHTFFCETLKESLQNDSKFNVVKIFTCLDSLINYTSDNLFDVLILDVNFAGKSSLDVIPKIRKNRADFKIITLTSLDTISVRQNAIKNGIDNFVSKSSDFSVFKGIILQTFNNKTNISINVPLKPAVNNITLSKRKLEILQILYLHSNKKEIEIAKFLNCSINTLKTHKQQLFEITNTTNSLDLVKYAIENGIILT